MNHNAFGFIPESQECEIPSTRFCLEEFSFAVTSDFAKIARNHCCATMLTNYCLFLEKTGKLSSDKGALPLFCTIHRVVHNGPIIILKRKAQRSLLPLGVQPAVRDLGIRSFMAKDIKAGRIAKALLERSPCALLVAAGPLSWHWILALGTVCVKDSSELCLLISDGWHRKVRLYHPDQGCRILRAYALSA